MMEKVDRTIDATKSPASPLRAGFIRAAAHASPGKSMHHVPAGPAKEPVDGDDMDPRDSDPEDPRRKRQDDPETAASRRSA